MTIQVASKGVRSYTSFLTSALFENKAGYCCLKTSKMSASATPIKNEETTTTTTENFAVLGCAAPNSFDTLTLQPYVYLLVLLAIISNDEYYELIWLVST